MAEKDGDDKSPIAYDETTPISAGTLASTGLPRFKAEDKLANRYRIVRHIASGGMGDVYEAEDLELKERVALKTVRADIASKGALLDRFKREIQLARKVTHPNVCRIFEFGTHAEVAFLTMELLAGDTLAQKIRSAQRLSSEESLPIVEQMAAALDAAHQAGVIHRDFKSGNVMLTPAKSGGLRVVVTDFGLARADAVFGEADTASSGFVGTPSYMAPEQVEGGEVGPPTDVYALGVVMFEMVTGKLPFRGDSALSTAVKRLKEDPPRPKSLAADLPAAWDQTILRCLERDAKQRFPVAGQVAAALRGHKVARPRSRLPRIALAALAAVLLSGALGFVLWPRSSTVDLGGLPLRSPRDRVAARAFAEGVQAFWEDDDVRAREQLRAVVVRSPSEAALARALLAHVYHRLGDAGEWRRYAEKATMLIADADQDTKLLVQATAREAARDVHGAIEAYRALSVRHPQSIAAGLFLLNAQQEESPDDAKATLHRLQALPAPLGDDPRIDLQGLNLGESFSDQIAMMRSAAERAAARHLPLVQAKALHDQAWALWVHGELDQAVAIASQSKQIYLDASHPSALKPLNTIAIAQVMRGNLREGNRAMEEMIKLARDSGNRRGEAVGMLNKGVYHSYAGELDEADRLIAEGAKVAASVDVQYTSGLVALDRGWMAQVRGRLADAERIYEKETLPALRSAGEQQHLLAWTLTNQGELRLSEGDLVGARARLQEAADLRSKLAQQVLLHVTLRALAEVDLEEGRAAAAESAAQKIADELHREGARDDEARTQVILARALMAQGKLDRAREIVDVALGRLRVSENPRVRHAISLADAELRGKKSPAAAAEAFARVEEVRAESEKLGLLGDQLEARRVAAGLQLAAGNRAAKSAFSELEKDARQAGFGLIASKAARIH